MVSDMTGESESETTLYAINKAKTEYREAFNKGEPSRILKIADPEVVNFSEGQPSGRGLESLKQHLDNFFALYTAELTVIIAEIRVGSDIAHDYGWNELTLTPKAGGEAIYRRYRYVDVWRKNHEGQWKLWMYIDNADVKNPFVPPGA